MIGIIGAMENEVSLLREAIENLEVVQTGRIEFYTGKLDGKDVVLLRCGIGKVNASVGCALLIQRFQPDFVLNTGSAGGIDPSLHFGDVIVSSALLYHDVDVTAFGYAPGQLPGLPPFFPANENLILKAEQAVDELKREKILPENLNHLRGVIGSADTFMCDPEKINSVRRRFPDISAVEMEGAAIAHCCHLFSIPVLVIRALSDIAGEESPVKFDEFLPVASKHSAEIVRRIIRKS